MFGPANICGCELGGDCTKTTECAIQAALEDQAEEYERSIEKLLLGFHDGKYEFANDVKCHDCDIGSIYRRDQNDFYCAKCRNAWWRNS